VQERELIIAELWERLANVTGVVYTARNPKKPPSAESLPAIQFFELGDLVEEASSRGGYPAYRRRVTVVIECFIAGSSESAATKELGAFVQEMKKKVYEGGATLGRRCSISERDASRILRPPAGSHVAGVGIAFEIRYVENISTLITP